LRTVFLYPLRGVGGQYELEGGRWGAEVLAA